ncbi:MAG: hypothetical protein RRC34_02850 [Lentisphaeria bacterium]|nr:hypothetical protein [Lentisphaeria bacterium]
MPARPARVRSPQTAAHRAAREVERRREVMQNYWSSLVRQGMPKRLRFAWLAVTKDQLRWKFVCALTIAVVLVPAAWGLGDLIGRIVY